MRVLILYETRKGFTLEVARAIREGVRARGIDATTAALGTVDAGTLAAAHALVVGTWTAGKIVVGVGPPGTALDAIEGLPRLGGRPAAVYCTYGVAPRGTLQTLASRLIGRGAVVEIGGAFRNGLRPGTRRKSLAKVPAFVDEALGSFERAGSTAHA